MVDIVVLTFACFGELTIPEQKRPLKNSSNNIIKLKIVYA